jgi:hypothetical protein
LGTHASSYSFCKEKRVKPDRKSYALPYGFINPYRNLKSENSKEGGTRLMVRGEGGGVEGGCVLPLLSKGWQGDNNRKHPGA